MPCKPLEIARQRGDNSTPLQTKSYLAFRLYIINVYCIGEDADYQVFLPISYKKATIYLVVSEQTPTFASPFGKKGKETSQAEIAQLVEQFIRNE